MKGYEGNIVRTINGGGLSLSNPSGTILVKIDSHGKIEKSPGMNLELDENIGSNLLGLKIVSNGALMGYLGIKFASDDVHVTSSSGLESALSSYKNSLVLESLSNRYSAHFTHLGNSSEGPEGVVYAFDTSSLNEMGELDPAYKERSDIDGLESYPTKTGIGWEGTNRSLLEVASETTFGNATKFYQTFSTITLGDAVAHLPHLDNGSNFDRTIGKQISVGKGEQIESYKRIDANGDGVPDVVIFYEGGKIQLLMNYGGSLKDMGYIAYVSDAGKERK